MELVLSHVSESRHGAPTVVRIEASPEEQPPSLLRMTILPETREAGVGLVVAGLGDEVALVADFLDLVDLRF